MLPLEFCFSFLKKLKFRSTFLRFRFLALSLARADPLRNRISAYAHTHLMSYVTARI